MLMILEVWFIVAAALAGTSVTFYDVEVEDAALAATVWPVTLGALLVVAGLLGVESLWSWASKRFY